MQSDGVSEVVQGMGGMVYVASTVQWVGTVETVGEVGPSDSEVTVGVRGCGMPNSQSA